MKANVDGTAKGDVQVFGSVQSVRSQHLTKYQIRHPSGARAACVIAAAVVLAFTAGCASVPAPTEQMAVTRAAVTDAVSAGGTEYAAVEMRSAQEKLNQAGAAVSAEDYVRARRLAEESEVDARLAATRARSAKAQRAVAELQESVRVLREEINRRSP